MPWNPRVNVRLRRTRWESTGIAHGTDCSDVTVFERQVEVTSFVYADPSQVHNLFLLVIPKIYSEPQSRYHACPPAPSTISEYLGRPPSPAGDTAATDRRQSGSPSTEIWRAEPRLSGRAKAIELLVVPKSMPIAPLLVWKVGEFVRVSSIRGEGLHQGFGVKQF
jgi:hypothetical protein